MCTINNISHITYIDIATIILCHIHLICYTRFVPCYAWQNNKINNGNVFVVVRVAQCRIVLCRSHFSTSHASWLWPLTMAHARARARTHTIMSCACLANAPMRNPLTNSSRTPHATQMASHTTYGGPHHDTSQASNSEPAQTRR